jgi:hypothetical protein
MTVMVWAWMHNQIATSSSMIFEHAGCMWFPAFCEVWTVEHSLREYVHHCYANRLPSCLAPMPYIHYLLSMKKLSVYSCLG